MTHKRLVIFMLALFGTAALRAAEDNPFERAKVGDWAQYSLVIPQKGEVAEQTHKVIKKTDKDVTLESTIKPSPNLPAEELKDIPQDVRAGQTTVVTIPLNRQYNPQSLAKGEVKSEEVGHGQDKFTIKGKEIEAQWTESKVTYTEQNKPVNATVKIWTSTDVPLGLVKQEVDTPKGQSVLMLKDFGSGGA